MGPDKSIVRQVTSGKRRDGEVTAKKASAAVSGRSVTLDKQSSREFKLLHVEQAGKQRKKWLQEVARAACLRLHDRMAIPRTDLTRYNTAGTYMRTYQLRGEESQLCKFVLVFLLWEGGTVCSGTPAKPDFVHIKSVRRERERAEEMRDGKRTKPLTGE
ncbi:hypothetical protein DXG01_012551 [Tephrocybe rancida]|nr:hypothetical protein DXG01_012551 [Tephrocybe rancida]